MEPVFLDLHIHTSENPDRLNQSYDLQALRRKVEEVAGDAPALISLTDHNTINKTAYLGASSLFAHLLLGAELHVRNYPNAPAYHCHIFFRTESIDEPTIDGVNNVLDLLYPKKMVANSDDIPTLEKIVRSFDDYEFLLLPHGGQSHSTFDESIPEGVRFDSTIERSIYYNHFDGFTARSNPGLGRTQSYFETLGIGGFVNPITSTDNYRPSDYPRAKDPDAPPFVPTWMLAAPTFNGLRLSLSESDRMVYGEKPSSWAEYIQSVSLKNESVDVDVTLTPGLNVIIGGSSSGKSLFVDSVYRAISDEFEGSVYLSYGVEDIVVRNPSGQTPHFLPQNYIMLVCDQRDHENKIDDISILKNVFPEDSDQVRRIDRGLADLGKTLSTMIVAVEQIELLEDKLKRIQALSRLIVTRAISRNPLKYVLPDDEEIRKFAYSDSDYEQHVETLDEIDEFLANDPLVEHDAVLIEGLKAELKSARDAGRLEASIRAVILQHYNRIRQSQLAGDEETARKKQGFGTLLDCIRKYKKYHADFYASLERISRFSISSTTNEIESMGHRLFIENEFELTKEKFLEVLNSMLRKDAEIKTFEAITPAALFKSGFRMRDPKVESYEALVREVTNRFRRMNKKSYRILTKDGKEFDQLSAGWKTSVILDLVLGWESDTAPLIIDQPEDNLATGYINSGLLRAIKQCKKEKQVILVSHNATIPMLGDAQNVVVCQNRDKYITIRSSPLEGDIGGTDVVDLVAAITDGGKGSIKKRVKKYNLKTFKG